MSLLTQQVIKAPRTHGLAAGMQCLQDGALEILDFYFVAWYMFIR